MRFASLALVFACCAQLPAQTPAKEMGAALFQSICLQCHGPRGEGNEQVKAPSIANLPSWYVLTQLSNFHDGKRGDNAANDPQGAVMAAIAKALKPDQIQAVAEHVESLALVVPEKLEIEGASVADGMMLFQERCMECHRYNASGEMAFGSPPLIGRQGWYLMAQLQKFKHLHRGAAKGDEKGAKMVQMATLFIEDAQAIKDVVSYILTLNPKPVAGGQDGDAKAASN